MSSPEKSQAELLQELTEVRARLEEAEETLRAIQAGEVDALVMGEEVYTLKGAETPYRILIEQMYEGAATLGDDGTVLYANRRLGELLKAPLQDLIGSSLRRFVAPAELPVFDAKLAEGKQCSSKSEFSLQCQDGSTRPVQLSFSVVHEQNARPICVVVTDLTERKRAEVALLEQERDFHTLAEAVPQVVWATRPDGWNIFFNQQWVDYTGLTLEESYGHGWNTPFHPDDKQRAWEAWQRATQHNEPYSLECRLRRADGTYRWWLIRGVPLLGANGEILKWFGTCTDIEDIKRAEALLQQAHDTLEQRVMERTAQLQQSEALLRSITDNSPDPIFLKDRGSRLLLANPATLAALQKSAEEVLGKTDEEFYDDPALGRLMLANDRRVMESGQTEVIEEVVPGPNGPRTFLSAKTPYRDAEGHVIGIIGIARDITERKRAEAALRESENRLRLALTATDLGTWDFNPVTGALVWDARCKELFGLSPETEVNYDTFLTGLHPEDRERANQIVQRAFDPASKGLFDIEYRTVGLRDGGVLRWVRATGRAAFNDAGHAIRFIGTVQDITARRQAEADLERTRNMLAEGQRIAHLGSWEYLAETQTTVWSDEQKRIYGLDPAGPSPVYAEMLRHHIHPDDAAALDQAFGEALRTDSVFENENRIVRPDGSVRFIYNKAQPYFDESGKLVRYVGATLDITERKRAEEALRASELRLALAKKSAGAGVWDWDMITQKLEWSAEMFLLFGLDPIQAKATFETWRGALHPDDREAADEQIRLAVQDHARLENEYRIVRTAGEVRWISALGDTMYDANGRPLRMSGICVDITERKRAEETLRFLAQSGDTAAGEDFFQALARHLGQSLGMDYVCIDRLEEGLLAARTVAIYFDGKFEDNVSYTLKDTPCGDVVGKTICCFPKDVRHLFPKDAVLQEMVAESYVGVTLWGSQGQPIGLIAVLGRKPLADTRLATAILQLVAVRAAAELERQEAEAKIRRHAEEVAAANEELTRFNEAMVGRELRMIELKREVDALCAQFGQTPRYEPESAEPARPAE